MSEEKIDVTNSKAAKLLLTRLGPEEEWDLETAEFVLRVHGIDPEVVAENLRKRLNQEIAHRRSKGEEVPKAMLAALASLPAFPRDDDASNDPADVR